MSTDKIDIHYNKLINSTHTHISPLDFSPEESLESGLASHLPSDSRFIVIIPSHDFESFVTDYHKRWFTQPQSPRLPAAPLDCSHDQETDFVLFPTSNNHRQARRQTELAPVTSHTVPNLRTGTTYHGQQQHGQRRHSIHQASVAFSSQTLQVDNRVQGSELFVSSPSSKMSKFSGHSPQFYPSSSPTSSAGLNRSLSSCARPPVPLFSDHSLENADPRGTKQMALDTPEGEPILKRAVSFDVILMRCK